MSEEALTDEQMGELVQMIMVLAGQNRYAEVLQIWSQYFEMVFEQERKRDRQYAEIIGSLSEQLISIRTRAAKVAPEDRDMNDAAEIMAIEFIRPIVNQAFDFTTYSGAKRCAYIRNALQVEIDNIEAQIGPHRHILEEFKGD